MKLKFNVENNNATYSIIFSLILITEIRSYYVPTFHTKDMVNSPGISWVWNTQDIFFKGILMKHFQYCSTLTKMTI